MALLVSQGGLYCEPDSFLFRQFFQYKFWALWYNGGAKRKLFLLLIKGKIYDERRELLYMPLDKIVVTNYAQIK